MLLGGIYPGLYALGGTVEIPPAPPQAEIAAYSSSVTVRYSLSSDADRPVLVRTVVKAGPS